MRKNGLFSCESVSAGHPDKLADRISDSVLDAFLKVDKNARVGCETMLGDGYVKVGGEFKTRNPDDFELVKSQVDGLVRNVIRDAGYGNSTLDIDPNTVDVEILFNKQSEDISRQVDRDDGLIGAGDQGSMFGYATAETAEYLPMPLVFAHKMMMIHDRLVTHQETPFLRPDAKSQVTMEYINGSPMTMHTIVVSTQHEPDIDVAALRERVYNDIISQSVPPGYLTETPASQYSVGWPAPKVLINHAGDFVIGGPKGDVGLTGRKIIVDTYGGAAPHGGGAFSGKDPSKVDRSAAYMARFLAKVVIGRGWAREVQIHMTYAIGGIEPIGFSVDTFGTTATSNIDKKLLAEFDLRPAAIIDFLDLKNVEYAKTSTYGHFGREIFPWESKFKEYC